MRCNLIIWTHGGNGQIIPLGSHPQTKTLNVITSTSHSDKQLTGFPLSTKSNYITQSFITTHLLENKKITNF